MNPQVQNNEYVDCLGNIISTNKQSFFVTKKSGRSCATVFGYCAKFKTKIC